MTPQQAIMSIKKHNEVHSKRERNAVFITEALCMAVDALEKTIAKKPVHIHEEYDHHEWRKKEDGSIDEFAWSYESHNGVACERCNETYCIFCDPDYDEKGDKCIIDEHYCPNCGKYIISSDEYCNKCGQHIDWSESNG